MTKYTPNTLWELSLDISKPSIIYLYWDLWAGKTTLSQHIINQVLGISWDVHSPTYTYYNRYQDVYHFDLYRLSNYDEFISIWWEEILDNNEWIILIEWPELIEPYYDADICIRLEKTWTPQERDITVEYRSGK